MNDSAWHWARLDREGTALVQETESALGADFVLAYGPGGPVADASILAGLAPVALTKSELECLQGVESKLPYRYSAALEPNRYRHWALHDPLSAHTPVADDLVIIRHIVVCQPPRRRSFAAGDQTHATTSS